MMSNRMEGAQLIIKTLERLGVEYIFGYSGGAVIPIFDALVTTNTKIKLIAVRHEQGAVHMADGYARATGKPGVVLVTSGPGAGNAITGLMTAQMDSVPLVLISGQQIRSMLGLDAFQETDVINLSMPVVKHNYQINDVTDIAATLHEAFTVATEGRPGPVVVDIPKDISAASCEDMPIAANSTKQTNQTPSEQDLQAIADAINEAERPLLLIGHGVLLADASTELSRFAIGNNIPVVTTLLGKGAFDEEHDLSLGMLGMHGTAYANKAIMETDCLINIGSRFDDRIVGDTEAFANQATVCHIDIDPTEINKIIKTDHAAVSDAKTALKHLLDTVRHKDTDEWMDRIRHLKRGYPLKYSNDKGLTQQAVIDELCKATKGSAIISTDVGQHQMWAAQFYKVRSAHQWLSSGGAGTMGYGFPAAIGAQLGQPGKTVVSISGDGGFQMTEYELATAAIHKLPVKIVVLDNKYLGMVRQWQELFYDDRESGVSLEGNPDFVKLADAYGIKGIHIDSPDKLTDKINEALAYDEGPVLVWCEVVKSENVYPMIPAGRSYDHMLIENPKNKLQKPVGST